MLRYFFYARSLFKLVFRFRRIMLAMGSVLRLSAKPLRSQILTGFENAPTRASPLASIVAAFSGEVRSIAVTGYVASQDVNLRFGFSVRSWLEWKLLSNRICGGLFAGYNAHQTACAYSIEPKCFPCAAEKWSGHTGA